MKKLMFVVNTDHFFLSHRLPIALKAMERGYEVHMVSNPTGRTDEIQALGITVHSLFMDRKSMGIWTNVRTFFRLLRIFKRVKPDLAHLVTIKPVLLGGLAARLTKVPGIVIAISGLGVVFLSKGVYAVVRRRLACLLYRLVFKGANLSVILQNENDRKHLSTSCSASIGEHTLIRGSGVALDHYKSTPLPEERTRIVLMASRLLTDKGAYEFVAAARVLKTRYPDVRFVLAGEPDAGNPATISEATLRQWISEGAIEHWGHRRDMPHVLSLASIVVLPSYREGLPKVLIEAAACGRPVVTTDVPGCRDAIEPNKTGLLVEPRDASSLAQAIEVLLEDRALRETMGCAGRALAERAFDVKQVVARHMQIYETRLQNARCFEDVDSYVKWRDQIEEQGIGI